MSKPSEPDPDRDRIREKILGLGEQSIRKNYYPQLQARIQELEESQARLEEKSAALYVSEEKYRRIVESIPLGMHIYRLEEDNRLVFIGANPTADKILGLDHSQFIGQTIEQAFPNFRQTEIPEQYRRVAVTGQAWQTDQIIYPDEYTTRVFEVHAFQTSPGYMAATFLDITERKQHEIALRESEEHYRSLFKNNHSVMLVIDPDGGDIVDANPAACTYYGYTWQELTSKKMSDINQLSPEPLYPEMNPVKLEEQRQPYFLRHRLSGGEVREVEVFGGPIRLGNRDLLYSIVHDITERKQIEEKFLHAQKMDAVGRLTAGVAHDFNNLLTVINGYSELILSNLNSSNDSSRHGLEQIQQAGQRATALTRQLLAFSRKQIFQPQIINPNTVVSGLDKMLHRLIGEDISLMTGLTPDLGSVKADAGQLEQVLINLAVNARDALPDGGHLTIETANIWLDNTYTVTHPDMQPGPYVLLVVSDDGVGMSEEIKSHIFEPFFTTKEQGKGTGLGLAAVYGIIKQSEGYITVYSEVGHGSTFRIYLPRVMEATPSQLLAEAAQIVPSGNETILLVEDDLVVRRLARHMLEGQGYTILEACNGPEALQVATTYQPRPIHLLLTDVVMPGMNGKTLATELTRIHPNLKVLFMSGYMDDAIVHHGVLESHMAFLPKPFSHLALAGKVRAVLDAQA